MDFPATPRGRAPARRQPTGRASPARTGHRSRDRRSRAASPPASAARQRRPCPGAAPWCAARHSDSRPTQSPWDGPLAARARDLDSQRRVLGDHRLARVTVDRGPRRGRERAHRLGILEIGLDRRHDDTGFNGDQIDADERDADPGVDDDAFVQHPVEDVDEACAAACPFDWHRSVSLSVRVATTVAPCVALARRERSDLALEQPHLAAQLLVLRGQTIAVRGQVGVVLPPVEADLLRLVDGAHDQTNPDGEQFDFGEGNLDVAGHDQALVENPVEDVDEPTGAAVRELEIRCSHSGGRSSPALICPVSIGCSRTCSQSMKTFSHHPRGRRRSGTSPGGAGQKFTYCLENDHFLPFLGPPFLGRISARNLPVYDPGVCATISGGPSTTISPPSSPPSGPRSTTQSAARTTSRRYSTRTTVLPASTWRLSTSRTFLTSSRCRPVVGSSSR